MSRETQSVSAFPRQKSPAHRWREFCEQWRHSYLLLAAIFLVMWRVSALLIPKLEHTRFMRGLHPMDVLLLKNMLELMWVPPLVAIVLYATSFWVPRLNTPAAIAVSALSSAVLLAFVLLWALFHISLWSG